MNSAQIPPYPYIACFNVECGFSEPLPLTAGCYECPRCGIRLYWIEWGTDGEYSWHATNFKVKYFKLAIPPDTNQLTWIE